MVPLPGEGLAKGALLAAWGKYLSRKAQHPLKGRGYGWSSANCKDPLHLPKEKE